VKGEAQRTIYEDGRKLDQTSHPRGQADRVAVKEEIKKAKDMQNSRSSPDWPRSLPTAGRQKQQL
jgi:hypothetical protein